MPCSDCYQKKSRDCNCDSCYQKNKKSRDCNCRDCYQKNKKSRDCNCDDCYKQNKQKSRDCNCEKCKKECQSDKKEICYCVKAIVCCCSDIIHEKCNNKRITDNDKEDNKDNYNTDSENIILININHSCK